jgi:ribosomal 50S subunit-associated protein YjgA (DUF615 family)
MKTFTLCLLVGMLVVGHWVHVMAQEGSVIAIEVASDAAIATDDADVDALRNELLRLTEQAAMQMDLEQLRSEVETARRRVSDSAADEKLEEIREQLAELVEQYPETDAANLAAVMLNVSDGTLQIAPFEWDGSGGAGRFPNFY